MKRILIFEVLLALFSMTAWAQVKDVQTMYDENMQCTLTCVLCHTPYHDGDIWYNDISASEFDTDENLWPYIKTLYSGVTEDKSMQGRYVKQIMIEYDLRFVIFNDPEDWSSYAYIYDSATNNFYKALFDGI